MEGGKVYASYSTGMFPQQLCSFKTRCVDLRVCDIKSITRNCKSWLYQDMFAKPEETVLHRPQHYGGLGMHSVKYKALAGYITTFLQTAANPSKPGPLSALQEACTC